MKQQLDQALKTLHSKNLLLYPTDTVYGIGCDATNAEAVSKVYQLKQRDDSKALICLVNNLEMLKKYVTYIPDHALEVLAKAQKPTTIIYENVKGFAPNLIASEGSVAIRICQTEFCQKLISKFNKPIVSTSANISGEPTPTNFSEISLEILKGVDYVVNLPKIKTTNVPSQLLKLNKDGSIEVIRH